MCAKLREANFSCVHYWARGVDTQQFNSAHRDPELRRLWGAHPDDPVVVYVGRLAGEKNIPLLIRTFEALREREPRLKLVLVGDGPERKSLEQSHPDYIFAGSKVGDELGRYYASGDLFLFPSISETYGNVVSEAMASGLVTLAYDYAAGRKLIRHGRNGFVAPFNDENAFVETAITLLAQRNRWLDIRDEARSTALKMSWESVIDRYLNIIENLA